MLTCRKPEQALIDACQAKAKAGKSPLRELQDNTGDPLEIVERADPPLPGTFMWAFPLEYPNGVKSLIVCRIDPKRFGNRRK